MNLPACANSIRIIILKAVQVYIILKLKYLFPVRLEIYYLIDQVFSVDNVPK